MAERVRVIVTGCRSWSCHGLAGSVVGRLLAKHGLGLVIVHGAAPGVDSAFAEACNDQGVEHEPHPADWSGKGRGAGPIRNQAMVDAGASMAIAVHRNLPGSRGTRDCVRRCLAAEIPVWLLDDDRGDQPRPRRIAEADLASNP